MKKIFVLAVLVFLVATPAMAALSVVGSKHDMIASGFAIPTNNTEVCIFCHTPHGAQTSLTQAPLWNNAAVDATAIYPIGNPGSDIEFTTYDLNSINATDARLCLACHDGTVGEPLNAPNSGSITTAGAAAMDANTIIGTDLSNDHPIGMDLGASPNTTDTDIRALGVIRGGGIGFGEDPFFGGNPMDDVNIMWCSSCHNVHDNTFDPFLRKNNAGSAMCKACHIK